jgi:hypothetical protein
MTPRLRRAADRSLRELRGIRAARALVRRERGRLRPGLYLACGRDGEVWRHWRQRVPAHLHRTKVDPGMRGRVPRAPLRRVRRGLVRALQFMLAPGVAWLRDGRADRRFAIAVAARDGGCVLLAPTAGLVARRPPWGPLPRRQLELAARWSDHFTGPEVEMAPDGHWMLERYVEGDHLGSLPVDVQLEVVRRLFAAAARLAAAAGEGDAEPLYAPMLRSEVHPSLPEQLRDHLGAHRDDLRTWPLVPTAADCHVRNLLVTPDRTPVLVDTWPFELRPFFYDPVYLATHAPPALPHLRYAFLDGAFDAELVALFGAVGLVLDPAPATRRSLAGMVLLLRAVREAGLLGGDRRRYEAEVAAGAPSERLGAAPERFLAVAARNWRTSILTER